MTTIEKVPYTGPANEMSGSSPPSEFNELGLGCRHKPYTKVIAAPQFNIIPVYLFFFKERLLFKETPAMGIH